MIKTEKENVIVTGTILFGQSLHTLQIASKVLSTNCF